MGQTNQLLEEIRDELRKIQKQEPADEVYTEVFVHTPIPNKETEQLLNFKKEIQYVYIPRSTRRIVLYLGSSLGYQFLIADIAIDTYGASFRIPPTSSLYLLVQASNVGGPMTIWGSSHPIGRYF